VKRPRPGAVKTRLAAAIGPEAAADLYRALVEHVLETTTPAPGQYERLVFFDPPEALDEMRAWLPGVRLLAQSGGGLGARMADAFARAFARGARRVAIVGTDVPGVSRATASEALSALDAADVVIGPPRTAATTCSRCGNRSRAVRRHRVEHAGRPRADAGAGRRRGALRARAGRLRDVDTLEDLRAEWPAVRGLLGAGRSGARRSRPSWGAALGLRARPPDQARLRPVENDRDAAVHLQDGQPAVARVAQPFSRRAWSSSSWLTLSARRASS